MTVYKIELVEKKEGKVKSDAYVCKVHGRGKKKKKKNSKEKQEQLVLCVLQLQKCLLGVCLVVQTDVVRTSARDTA